MKPRDTYIVCESSTAISRKPSEPARMRLLRTIRAIWELQDRFLRVLQARTVEARPELKATQMEAALMNHRQRRLRVRLQRLRRQLRKRPPLQPLRRQLQR